MLADYRRVANATAINPDLENSDLEMAARARARAPQEYPINLKKSREQCAGGKPASLKLQSYFLTIKA